ncbi:hypothetical protein H6796_00730 [Candidatus Nomurabacteria bacterium]|nr:hypothetical protein [Candidatus Nomurabacteria bacterium]
MAEPKYTVIPGVLDTRPIALEILGISPEAVKHLSVDGLSKAVKAMSRLYRAELHPDMHGGRVSKERTRRTMMLDAAMERFDEEGIESQREALLAAARKKSSKEKGVLSSYEIKNAYAQDLDYDFSDTLFESMYANNSIARLNNMRVIVSNDYDIYKDGDSKSYELLGGLSHDGIDVYDLSINVRDDDAVLGMFSDRANEQPYMKDVAILEQGSIGRVSDKAPFIDNEEFQPHDYAHESGIYVCRGIGAKRSVEVLSRRSRKPSNHIDHVNPIGCVSPAVWSELVKDKSVEKGDKMVYREIESSGVDAQRDRGVRFSGISFAQHKLGFDGAELNRAISRLGEEGFSTEFRKDWVLIGYHEKVLRDGARSKSRPAQLVPLGNIEYATMST